MIAIGAEMNWSIGCRHLVSIPAEFHGDSDELCGWIQGFAAGRVLEFDDYSDQINIFYRDTKGKRRLFAVAMAEG